MAMTSRRLRFGLVALVTAALLAGSVLRLASVCAAGDATGYQDTAWSAPGVDGPSGDKPQSKLWRHDGQWWGVLFDNDAEAFHIHQLDWRLQTWNDTGAAIDGRNASHADILSDGDRLYAATAVAPSPTGGGDLSIRVLRYRYEPAGRRYTLEPGFPVVIGSGAVEAVVLAKDTTGKLWVAYTQGGRVLVNRSLDGDQSWGDAFAPPVAGTAVSDDDIAAVIAFNGQIGLMWSNQLDGAFYFATHRDGDPDEHWRAGEPIIQAPGAADDHLNLKAVPSGGPSQLIAVVKTNRSDGPDPDPDAPLIMLLALGQDGRWTTHPISRVRDAQTRPIALIHESERMLYVFLTTALNGQTIESGAAETAIYYKRTRLDDIAFAEGQGTPFIRSDSSRAINDATSTKQNLTNATGLVALAADDDTKTYFHNAIELGPSWNPFARC
jgi:hypothetical protein